MITISITLQKYAGMGLIDAQRSAYRERPRVVDVSQLELV
jgi:hypothetical protein